MKAVNQLFALMKEMAPDATHVNKAIFNLGGGSTLDYSGDGFCCGSVDSHVKKLLARETTVYRVFNPELCKEVKRLYVRDRETGRHWGICVAAAKRATEDRIRCLVDARTKESRYRLIDPFCLVITPHVMVSVNHDTVITWHTDTEVLEAV